MAHTITGKLILMLPVETGQGKNGEWSKQSFVIETDGQYPKKVYLTSWGDTGKAINNVPEHSNLTVQFDVESREYNNRWYTELKAFKYTVNNVPVPQQQSMAMTADPLAEDQTENDPLPF